MPVVMRESVTIVTGPNLAVNIVLDELRQRVEAGDPTAPDDLARVLLNPLTMYLLAVFHARAAPDIAASAAEDAIIEYLARPGRARASSGRELLAI